MENINKIYNHKTNHLDRSKWELSELQRSMSNPKDIKQKGQEVDKIEKEIEVLDSTVALLDEEEELLLKNKLSELEQHYLDEKAIVESNMKGNKRDETMKDLDKNITALNSIKKDIEEIDTLQYETEGTDTIQSHNMATKVEKTRSKEQSTRSEEQSTKYKEEDLIYDYSFLDDID